MYDQTRFCLLSSIMLHMCSLLTSNAFISLIIQLVSKIRHAYHDRMASRIQRCYRAYRERQKSSHTYDYSRTSGTGLDNSITVVSNVWPFLSAVVIVFTAVAVELSYTCVVILSIIVSVAEENKCLFV